MPDHIWINWMSANHSHLAYDEPPENADQDCTEHYVSFKAYDAVVTALAETEALELQHGAVIDRLTAEHAQLVAANQALATENARLVDMARCTICREHPPSEDDLDRRHYAEHRAFLAGEGK